MPIIAVEPKTSKISGNVQIDVVGSLFLDNIFNVIPSSANGTFVLTDNAEIIETDSGIIFSVSGEPNSKAGYRINKLFPKAFKIKSTISHLPQTIPSVNKTKVFGLYAISSKDSQLKTLFFLEYAEDTGYLAVIERIEYGQILSRSELKIDPHSIKSISLGVGGFHHTGYIEVEENGKLYEILIGETDRILSEHQDTEYLIELFSQTPSTGYALDLRIKLEKVETIPFVSFAGYQGNIISITDSSLTFLTSAGSVSSAKEYLIFSNGNSVFAFPYVEYVDAQKIENITKHFDCVQAIHGAYLSVSANNLSKESSNFSWDKDFFIQENLANYNLAIPSLWDPSTGKLSSNFFQSGIDFGKTGELLDIVKFYSQEKEKWHPKIMHGTYYVNNVPYFLYSSDSIMEILSENMIENKSYINLDFMPKKEIPISIYALGKEKSKEKIIYKKQYKEVQKFSGKIINGVELDSLISENIDVLKNEFIVKRNPNNKIFNFKIPVVSNTGGIYSFDLPEKTMKDFPLDFSRKDIFINETNNLLNPGDYFVAYGTKSVSVKLPLFASYDFGFVNYTYQYPAVIYFNKNCVINKSSGIVSPEMKDIPYLDFLGISTGLLNQSLLLSSYPVIDMSTKETLDTNSARIFLYDEYTNTFDYSWKRVSSLKDYGPHDKVFEFLPIKGQVRFGDGVHGFVPPRFMKFYAAYKESLIIQYEPEGSSPFWIPKNKDLNLTKQNLTSGFLFLDRQEKNPTKIFLNFGTEKVGSFETTNLYATLFGADGQVISDAEINLEIVNGAGELTETKLITNSIGQVSTVYNPSNNFEDLATKVNLFEEGLDSETAGLPITGAYGARGGLQYSSLKIKEKIEGNVQDTLVFKIIDDGDPFLLYNNKKRSGGKFVLLYQTIGGNNVPVVPEYISETSVGFSEGLPQPFDENGTNYEPNLRGFFIVNKKTIQARAYLELVNGDRIYSNIASTQLELSAMQKGLWTLPIFPSSYNGSQINRATYIQINE